MPNRQPLRLKPLAPRAPLDDELVVVASYRKNRLASVVDWRTCVLAGEVVDDGERGRVGGLGEEVAGEEEGVVGGGEGEAGEEIATNGRNE